MNAALTDEQTQALKTHGWKWAKSSGGNLSTDRVDPEHVRDVTASPDGFVVRYNAQSVLLSTTAIVDKIGWPDDLEKTWIFVHWKDLADVRRPAPEAN